MKHFSYILLVIWACILTGCEQDMRDRNGILSEHAMIDVLYDYQVAMALATENVKEGKLAELEYEYTQAVFKKHGITDEEFRLSMAHYARNPKDMLAITDKVSERLTGEEKKADRTGDGANTYESTDTLVLWENRKGLALTSNSNNRYDFDIPSSKLKPCDRLILGFDTKWIYREGTKFGTFIFSVTFDNDSTATFTESIREFSKTQSTSVNVPQGRKVTQAHVTIYQSAFWQKYPQVLALSNLALWGIKTTKNEPKEPAKPADEAETKPNLPGGEPVNPKLKADTSAAATH